MKYEVTIEFYGGEIKAMKFKRDSLIEAKKVYNKYLNFIWRKQYEVCLLV